MTCQFDKLLEPLDGNDGITSIMVTACHLFEMGDRMQRAWFTVSGAVPSSAGTRAESKNDNVSSFADDTAAKTGKSKRTVERRANSTIC